VDIIHANETNLSEHAGVAGADHEGNDDDDDDDDNEQPDRQPSDEGPDGNNPSDADDRSSELSPPPPQDANANAIAKVPAKRKRSDASEQPKTRETMIQEVLAKYDLDPDYEYLNLLTFTGLNLDPRLLSLFNELKDTGAFDEALGSSQSSV